MKRNKYDVFYRLLKNQDFYLPVLLYLGAFLTRFSFLVLSDNFKGPQPMLNIITALHIFKDPGFMRNIYYQQLPVFLYSLFAVIKIGKDQLLSGRLLSVFWGSMSIVAYYYLVSENFNKRVAVLSSLLLCFLPVHVISSVITVPDIMGLFLLLSALFFLQKQKIVLSAIIITLATACTYVSWLFIFILPVLILIQKKQGLGQRLLNAFWFFLFACLFVVFWIMVTNSIYKEYNLFYKNFFAAGFLCSYVFAYMQSILKITRLLFSFGMPFLFLLGLAGIYQSVKMRKYYEFLFLIGSLILTLALGVFRQEINILEQGMLLILAFLIPFMVLGLDLVFRIIGLYKKRYSAVAIALICFSLLFSCMYARPYLPQKIKNLSSWIKFSVQDRNAKLFITKDKNPYYSAIIMLSGLPQGNFYYYKINDIKLSESKWNKADYLIYSEESRKSIRGDFKKVVKFDEYLVLSGMDK